MKKILFLSATVLLLTSCAKEKHCRCSVLGSQTVRIVSTTDGDCKKLNYISYRDVLDTLHIDSVVCTDYPFEGDTAIVYLNEE